MFHAAASGLFLESVGNHFDMVRVGTLLYGQYPDHTGAGVRTLDLRPTFELRSQIVAVHWLPKRSRIGYGGEFVCSRGTRVATVPVGYAQGLAVVPESVARRMRFTLRSLREAWQARRGRTEQLPHAKIGAHDRAPIIGRVSMDQCCLDVTDIPQADRGIEVVLPVRRVLTSPGIPRVYEALSDDETGAC